MLQFAIDEPVLDALPVQVWTAAPDGRLTFVNRFVCDYFGTGAQQLLGEGWQHQVHPADLPETGRRWSHSLLTGETYTTTLRLLRAADKQYRWHEARAVPLRDEAGEIVRWVGTNTDVDAAQRAAEVHIAALEHVRRERARVRELFAQTPVALSVLTGPEHRIEQMNERARRLLGGRNLEGLTVREALPELAGQELLQILDGVFASGVAWEGQQIPVRFDRLGDGQVEEGWFDIIYQPLRDDQDVVYGVISVSVEVTEHVRARQLLERLAADGHQVGQPANSGGEESG